MGRAVYLPERTDHPVARRNGARLRGAERRRLRIPVIIGGATTSDLHTAVRIAPVYSGVVVHSANASRNSQILARLLGPGGERYAAVVKAGQETLRGEYLRREAARELVPIAEARRNARRTAPHRPVRPLHPGRMVFPDYDVADVEPYIDWNFFPAWGMKGRYPEILDHPEQGPRRAGSSTTRRRCWRASATNGC